MLVCPMLNDARCWWALVATESAIATAAASAAVSPNKLCGSQWGRQKPFLLPPNGKMLREGCFLFLANDNRVVRILSVPRCLLFFGCLHESWPNRRRLWVALPALTELPFPQPQQWREDTACGIVINLPFGIVAILFIIHSCFPMYLYFLHKSKLVLFHSFLLFFFLFFLSHSLSLSSDFAFFFIWLRLPFFLSFARGHLFCSTSLRPRVASCNRRHQQSEYSFLFSGKRKRHYTHSACLFTLSSSFCSDVFLLVLPVLPCFLPFFFAFLWSRLL